MLKQLVNNQRAALGYFLLVICVPLFTLVLFGVIKLWQNSWLLPLSTAWLVITLVAFLLHWLFHKLKKNNRTSSKPNTSGGEEDQHSTDSDFEPTALPLQLSERIDWNRQDKVVWQRSLLTIEQILEDKPSWNKLHDYFLDLLASVSYLYKQTSTIDNNTTIAIDKNSSYRVTAPEILLVVAETSSRYRQLLLTHIPFADSITVSSIVNIYSKQGHIRRGAGWFNNARRVARLANPLTALVAELRDQFTGRLLSNLSEKLQHDLKRLLLQELVQVSMDLYSGRLKLSGEELAAYRSSALDQDVNNFSQPIEPVRVIIVGQVSSGKSSLVNALTSEMQAETDILPTTEATSVHQLILQKNGDSEQAKITFHLIDTVGLTHQTAAQETLVNTLSEADIIVWTSKATQPARAVDASVFKELQLFYESKPTRRAPPILLAITHVDQLSPKALWQPPYDLHSDNPKAKNMVLAIQSIYDQTGLPSNTVAIPLCLSEERGLYNIETLGAEIVTLHAEATLVQLNRRRLERSSRTENWQDRWQQARTLGRTTGKVLYQSIIK